MTAHRYEGRARVMIDGLLVTDLADAVAERPQPFAEAEEPPARGRIELTLTLPPKARAFFEGLRQEVWDYIDALDRWADDGGAA